MAIAAHTPEVVTIASPAAGGRSRLAVAPAGVAAVGASTRNWLGLAIGSLVVAGLLSLSVVVGRLPLLSGLVGDPLFFRRCLVVHVDLALVVWFYAFLAGLTGMLARRPPGLPARIGFAVAVAGVVAMLAGALVPGAEPVLANYVPVIDHLLFLAGLGASFAGLILTFVHTLARAAAGSPASVQGSLLPADARTGVLAAAVAVVLAFATWVSTEAGLPGGLDRWTRFEFSAWGAGHVLQVANVCAMLAVWLWLLAQSTGTPVLGPAAARVLFSLLVAPHLLMPLLTLRGSLNNLYHAGATQLMRWGIFPVVLVILALAVRHLLRRRPARDSAARVALAGFAASASLSVLGFLLGACIRGSNTLVPAHYHASLGAVTAAFMTAAYLVADAVSRGDSRGGLRPAAWKAARWQLALFGAGQAVFALGFAIGGMHGLGRKSFAAEQAARGAGEVIGLGTMALGGLVAVAGGIWFLFLILREMRGWWLRREAGSREAFTPSTP